MQMGYRRGGWYGYRPDRQRRHSQHREGSPGVAGSEGGRHRADMAEPGFPRGGALEANRYLVFASPNKHDSIALGRYPVDRSHMRLVWRIHLGPYNWASPLILAQLFADLAGFVVVRQNLRGIKARAEGRRPERQRTVYAELVLWVACFVVFLASEIVLLVRGLLRPLREPG